MKPSLDDREQTQDVQAFAEHFSSTRLQRLANITLNHLGLTVPDMTGPDVTVERREDGRVALVLPEAWAHLFLSHLTVQAEQIHERLRQAMWKARMKDARLQAEVQQAAKEWEAQQECIYERYKVLTGQGMTHRDAIRQIKKESRSELTATVIQGIVEGASPEKRRRRGERHERIRRKAEHLTRKEVAQQEGLSVHGVRYVLDKRRSKTRTYSKAELAQLQETRELVLALHAKGESRKEIAARLGVELRKVYNVLQNAGIRLRPGERGKRGAKANGS